MHQEAFDKRVGLKLCRLHAVTLPVVAKGEANLIAVDTQQTVVGHGDAMGIAPEITQGLLRTAKRGLGIDNPLLAAQSSGKGVEGLWRLQC